MNRIGKVTGYEVLKNRDGQNDRLMLQVEIVNSDDIQTVELRNSYGEDSNPRNNTQVLILEVGEAFKLAIAADDGITPSMQPGEKKIYSVSGSGIEAFINFLVSGVLELNGNSDFAVKFNALQTKLTALENQLKNHVHPGVTAGGASTGVSVTAFDIDISNAKVDTIKLP